MLRHRNLPKTTVNCFFWIIDVWCNHYHITMHIYTTLEYNSSRFKPLTLNEVQVRSLPRIHRTGSSHQTIRGKLVYDNNYDGHHIMSCHQLIRVTKVWEYGSQVYPISRSEMRETESNQQQRRLADFRSVKRPFPNQNGSWSKLCYDKKKKKTIEKTENKFVLSLRL